jgi:hypothetical protein
MAGRSAMRSFTSISVGVFSSLRTPQYKAVPRGRGRSRLPNPRAKHHNQSAAPPGPFPGILARPKNFAGGDSATHS